MTVFVMLTETIRNNYKVIIILIFFFALDKSQSFGNENLQIEIDNPKFSEKGLDNRLYEIKAERGIQRENNLELFIRNQI